MQAKDLKLPFQSQPGAEGMARSVGQTLHIMTLFEWVSEVP
jgi:hypothetical protein